MAFDMRVIGIRRDPRAGAAGHADAVHAISELKALLPQADFIALTCPLTAETEKLIDADALGRVKPSAYLLNAARGRVVDEPALVDALARRQIRGAALDVMVEEPLRAASPLWTMEHVLITPPYSRRDLPLRGRCARDHAGESRAALARRDRAAEPGGLDDRHCGATRQFHSRKRQAKKRSTSASSARCIARPGVGHRSVSLATVGRHPRPKTYWRLDKRHCAPS